MSWTSPSTFIAGATLSATTLNQQLRDNLLSLHNNRVSTIPSSGNVDQDKIVYIADATNRVLWQLMYYAAGPAGKQWEMIGGSDLRASFTAVTESPTTSLGNFSTPLSVTVPLAGDYLAEGSAQQAKDSASVPSLEIVTGGVASGRPVGGTALNTSGAGGQSINIGMYLRLPLLTSLAAATAISLQRKDSLGGTSYTFWNGVLAVRPLRVG